MAYDVFNMVTMRDYDVLQEVMVLSDDLKDNLNYNYEEMGFMLAPEVKRLPKNKNSQNVWINEHKDIDYTSVETQSHISMRFVQNTYNRETGETKSKALPVKLCDSSQYPEGMYKGLDNFKDKSHYCPDWENA